MDTDPSGQIEWGFYPVFGYFNPNNEYPALSRLPDSWPSGGWPSSEGQYGLVSGMVDLEEGSLMLI